MTKLISFYAQMISLVDEGKGVDIVHLDFSKALDSISHSILMEKLADHGLERYTLCWVKNCLDGQAQIEVVSEVNSAAHEWCSHRAGTGA